jgi:putative ABC transport system ATP-binding protein
VSGWDDRPVITLIGATKEFPGPPPVVPVRDCSMTVSAGEMVVITGASGSGKSTLLNLIGLLDSPTAGTYRLLGEDVSSLGDRQRARLRGGHLGFVFQAFHLLAHRDCVDNVLLGLTYGTPVADSRQRALNALERVGLGHRIDARPTTLSGGERQRVAIARAIVHEPAVLLCDEPTGNLDSVTSQLVLELLADLNAQGATVVLITHDPAVAAFGSRRLVMSDGVLSPG